MPTLDLPPEAEKEMERTIRRTMDAAMEGYGRDLAGIQARKVLSLPLPLFAQVDEGYAAGYRQALVDAAAAIGGKR